MDPEKELGPPLGCLKSRWSPSEMAPALRPPRLGLGGPVSLASGSFSDSLTTLGKSLPFCASVSFSLQWEETAVHPVLYLTQML